MAEAPGETEVRLVDEMILAEEVAITEMIVDELIAEERAVKALVCILGRVKGAADI